MVIDYRCMRFWITALKGCLVVLFLGALFGQVVGMGVYVTKFLDSPEQVLATAWLVVGLLTLIAAQAIAASVWALANRAFVGALFATGTRRWLRIIGGAGVFFVVPAIGLLLSMALIGEGATPAMYAAGVVATFAVLAAVLSLAIVSLGFNEALATKGELNQVI